MVDPGLPDMRASNWPWMWCRGSWASMWVVGFSVVALGHCVPLWVLGAALVSSSCSCKSLLHGVCWTNTLLCCVVRQWPC